MLFNYDPKIPKTDKLLKYLQEQTSKQEIYVSPPKRSSSQNRLFHSNAQILANHSGYSVDQMKVIIKQSITKAGLLSMVTYFTTKKGDTYPEYVSTADLDTKSFGTLMDYTFGLGKVLGCEMNHPEQENIAEYAKELFDNGTEKV